MAAPVNFHPSGERKLIRWWEAAKGQIHKNVFDCVTAIDNKHQERCERNLHYLRMYSNREATGLSGKTFYRQDSPVRISLNICKNLIDAATSKIATKQVRPFFKTSAGDGKLKKAARGLNQFTTGIHYATKLHAKARRVFKDGAIFDRGFLKVFALKNRPHCERVMPHEIIVDEEDAYYGEPRSLFQHKEVSKEVLKIEYPKFSTLIQSSVLHRTRGVDIYAGIADQCSVVEAWHLPSTEDAKDGRHVICTSEVVLLDENYSKPRYPFATFCWAEPIVGYWGNGISAEVESLQVEINVLLRKIQREMNAAGFKVAVQKGAEVNQAKLTNMTGQVIEYTGAKPEFFNANAVAPETFAQIERLEQKAYDITGISRLTAQAQKPAGLESRPALLSYYDIESERFQAVIQAYQEFILDATDLLVDVARDLAKSGVALEIMGEDRYGIRMIKWSDVNLDRDTYWMQMEGTNILPDQIPGRLERLKEMAGLGVFDQIDILENLNYPDIDSQVNRKLAPYRKIELEIDGMYEEGIAAIPLPFDNHKYAMQLCSYRLALGRMNKVPDENLELIRNYMSMAADMLRSAGQNPSGGAPGQGFLPPGIPLPMPQMPMSPGMLPGPPPLGAPGLPPGGPVPAALPPLPAAAPPQFNMPQQ